MRPGNVSLYVQALTHRSKTDAVKENNERLEFLGDAILDAVVGDFLFKKYPLESEGFLTEMRSKVVNRQSMNGMAEKMGLEQLIIYDRESIHLHRSNIYGNTLEALIGAVYKDKGYKKTVRFIQRRLLRVFVDWKELKDEEFDHKNKLYSWANKFGHQLEFRLAEDRLEGGRHLFTMVTVIDGDKVGKGKAYTKKTAGKRAAKATWEKLQLPETE